jgi:hypothetical protein
MDVIHESCVEDLQTEEDSYAGNLASICTPILHTVGQRRPNYTPSAPRH